MDYPKMVSCRMTSDDLDRLTASAQLAGMARSEYLRTLIRIPASASGKGAVYVIDSRTMAKMLSAVSYTHLDVYKRQGSGSSRDARARRARGTASRRR